MNEFDYGYSPSSIRPFCNVSGKPCPDFTVTLCDSMNMLMKCRNRVWVALKWVNLGTFDDPCKYLSSTSTKKERWEG